MSPDQWNDVVEEEIGEEEVPAEYHDPHDLTEAVWALWGQVDVLRQELDADRLGRERDSEVASAVMAEAVETLRGDLARRSVSPPESSGAGATAAAGGNAVPSVLRSLPGDVERIHAALLADRTERQRFEAALPALVRKEVERTLAQEAAARTQGDDSTQQAVKGAFDVLRAELRAGLRDQNADGPSVPKVVRSALDELKFQLIEERTQREARDAAIAPSLQAVDDNLMALHAELEAERRERYAGQQQAAETAKTVTARLTQLGSDLEEMRRAAARAEEAADVRHVNTESNQANAAAQLHDAVREELGDVGRALMASDEAHRAALADVATAIDELRRTAVEAARAAEAEDARYAESEAQQAAAVEVALNAVRGELAALRERWEAGEASAATAAAALREELADVRAKQAEQTARYEALQGELRQAREELLGDRQLRVELDAAGVAATEAMQARLAELRELVLQESTRQAARDGGAARREAWEAALGGALATLHDELLAQKEALASLSGSFADTRREQEALAFKLPEATQEMQLQVAQARGANVETVKQLEDLLRSTMSGANAWFVRTRDDLVQRLDQVASTVDLGIAESMVAVLEQLRADVAGVREELAALGRRQHLTAAQVRKIVKETAPDAADGNGKGKVSRPAKAAKARPA